MEKRQTRHEDTQKQPSRRDVIKGGLAAAGLLSMGALVGCAQESDAAAEADSSQDERVWTEQADVVVVGAGGAGFAAAIEAADAGASVILLESTAMVGGDSSLCAGILGAGGSRLATSQGVDVSADEIYGWFMENPEWYGPKDPKIARVLADNSGDTIDWLEEIGVPFEAEVAGRFGYTELPVIHQVDGGGGKMIQVLADHAKDIGITTLTETRATKLLPDESGRVVGVEADQGGTTIAIQANKGVILTTGGYSASASMLTSLNAECANVYPSSRPGVAGDGLVMARDYGVFTTREAEMPHLTSVAGIETGTTNTLNYQELLYGLWLDANGERFYDESTTYNNPLGHRAILRKQNAQGSPVFLLIGSTPELEKVMATTPLSWPTAETVEELAPMVGLDGTKVKATVDTYNGFCEAGKDEDFGRPAETLIPLTGPFYAASIALTTSVTLGGVKTNTNGQALKLNLDSGGDMTAPIPGLYAAGVACEWNTAAGATVLCAMTMGRIAGRNAAQEA